MKAACLAVVILTLGAWYAGPTETTHRDTWLSYSRGIWTRTDLRYTTELLCQSYVPPRRTEPRTASWHLATSTTTKRVYARGACTLNVMLIAGHREPIPDGVTAILRVNGEPVIIPLSGPPRYNEVLYSASTTLAPGLSIVAVSTDHVRPGLFMRGDSLAEVSCDLCLHTWLTP